MDYPKTVANVNLLAGKFTDGNPSGGTPASLVPAEWCNALTDELLNILASAGIAPDEADVTQLGQAVQTGMLNMATDTGAANAYAVAYTPAVKTLVNGMVLRFKAVNANTGASTLDVNGLGAMAINGLGGSALQGGEIAAGSFVKVIYVGASTFVLLSASSGALPVAPATKSHHAVNLGQFALNVSGYLVLPSGAIFQWGTCVLTGTNTAATGTFPTTFPNNCLGIVSSDSGITTWATGISAASPSSYNVWCNPYSTNTGALVAKNALATVRWVAIGN